MQKNKDSGKELCTLKEGKETCAHIFVAIKDLSF